MSSGRDYDAFSAKYIAASFVATYFSGVMHPLDLIKTRFQSHDGKSATHNLVPNYGGVHHALKIIYRSEGLRGLYKGFYISLLCQASSMSFFFWHYETRKDRLQREGMEVMKAVTQSSIQASVITTLATQPIWVLKTRMLLNVKRGIGELENLKQQVRQISVECGPRGFLRGLELSLLLSFTGVIQMYVYEGAKLLYGRLGIPESPAGEKHFLCGSVSKLFSGLLAHPITTLRTRIQQSQVVSPACTQKYRGLQDLAATTWRQEGIYGFYKGFSANLVRGVTQKGIYFYFYEILKDLLFPSRPHQN